MTGIPEKKLKLKGKALDESLISALQIVDSAARETYGFYESNPSEEDIAIAFLKAVTNSVKDTLDDGCITDSQVERDYLVFWAEQAFFKDRALEWVKQRNDKAKDAHAFLFTTPAFHKNNRNMEEWRSLGSQFHTSVAFKVMTHLYESDLEKFDLLRSLHEKAKKFVPRREARCSNLEFLNLYRQMRSISWMAKVLGIVGRDAIRKRLRQFGVNSDIAISRCEANSFQKVYLSLIAPSWKVSSKKSYVVKRLPFSINHKVASSWPPSVHNATNDAMTLSKLHTRRKVEKF
jgi:hypothetical protein